MPQALRWAEAFLMGRGGGGGGCNIEGGGYRRGGEAEPREIFSACMWGNY